MRINCLKHEKMKFHCNPGLWVPLLSLKGKAPIQRSILFEILEAEQILSDPQIFGVKITSHVQANSFYKVR